jgi:hypothetical protein
MCAPTDTLSTLPAGARPDEFFTADQIRRMHHLTTKRHQALDHGDELPADERAELFHLIDEHMIGMMARARKMHAEGKL